MSNYRKRLIHKMIRFTEGINVYHHKLWGYSYIKPYLILSCSHTNFPFFFIFYKLYFCNSTIKLTTTLFYISSFKVVFSKCCKIEYFTMHVKVMGFYCSNFLLNFLFLYNEAWHVWTHDMSWCYDMHFFFYPL